MIVPAILVFVGVFIAELCGSPVYNMQPAFITTNIGTTGRNIRNLPCISRKSNQSGVCMFAIDCLKSNGTHLGTCIDRFYFGSCCHIEHVHDISENTIDDIIPHREPPERLSSTIKPIFRNHTTTRSTTSTTTSTTTASTTPSTTTTSTTPSTTQLIEDETTTVGYKLTTFQSVDGAIPSETTFKPSTTSTTTTTTTTRTTAKPSKTTKIPIKTTKKPIKTTTTKKPSTSTRRTTITTTTRPRRPVTTTKRPSSSTKRPTSSTTSRATTKKPISTTTNRIITRKPTPPPPPPPTTTTTTTTTTTAKTTITQATTASPNLTEILKPVNGNTATNEIAANTTTTQKPTTTTKSNVVTWTIVDSTTSPTPVTTSTISSVTTTQNSTLTNTTEAWQPITTPDGWVLLPSVPPSTTSEEAASSSVAPVTQNMTDAGVNVTTVTSVKPGGTTVTTTAPPEIRPVNMSDFTDVCGRRMYPEARIVGGEKSSFGKWPWQISLRQWRTSTYLHKCGAALLNENWAITAAHCVDNVPPSDLLLRLGEHDLSTESEPYLHQERRVQIVASHPQFDPRTFEYDLALLRFYEPVTFQPNILPVCVPQTDENFVGRTAYVTGWGRLYEDGPLPSVLQEVSVPVINNTVCESMYRSAGYIEHIPHIFICAGWRRGGFDSCEGDSGGPMVIQRQDKRFLLAGVISWGIGCAEPNQPGVYTRISEFRDWINQILQF